MANKRVKIKIEVLKNVIKDLENKAKEHYEDGSETGIYTAEACQCILDTLHEQLFRLETGRD